MFTRRNVSLTDHLILPLIVLAVIMLAFDASPAEKVDRRMPTVAEYPILSEGPMGTLSCGKAYLEVRQGKTPVKYVSVWYLNGRILAVQFVHNGGNSYIQSFVDVNFDGLWDSNKITYPGRGDEGSHVLYRAVPGCGDGWFK